ncbi:MAG: hypothetical protein R6U50_01050 [Desulfobacterales bacterium]
MSSYKDTPVLLLIFNRPDTTARVFEAIARARPRFLYIAADGPRPNVPQDAEKCRSARNIVSRVDWDCEVRHRFIDQNLGCRMAVSSAIAWFFDQVESGIILEDDCLPAASFFPFCSQLLEKYRDDERIMSILGNNFQNGIQRGDAAYYFSSAPWIWGWASWRRAWKHYDLHMKTFPDFVRGRCMENLSRDLDIQNFLWKYFITVYENGSDTWDWQWFYAILVNHGLCIVPQVNLVSNIGFSAEATHTRKEHSKYADIPLGDIREMTHPWAVLPDHRADDYFYKHFMRAGYDNIKNPLMRWRKVIKRRHRSRKRIDRFLTDYEWKLQT